MPKSLPVESIADFVKTVCEIRDRWTGGGYFDPWFRGQQDASWSLRPGLYRLDLEEDEEEIRSEFQRRGLQLVGDREPRNEWEWYFLMQHHGAPTRLLDWTDSALVGLFFALNSFRPGSNVPDVDAAVWMLDPWWLNGLAIRLKTIVLTDWDEAKPYLPRLYEGSLRRRLPLAIDPPHVARRVSVQRSRFTIHGTEPDGLSKLARRRASRLVKITIPRQSLLRMRNDLFTCGITDTTVFPDLEGLARELSRFYTEDW